MPKLERPTADRNPGTGLAGVGRGTSTRGLCVHFVPKDGGLRSLVGSDSPGWAHCRRHAIRRGFSDARLWIASSRSGHEARYLQGARSGRARASVGTPSAAMDTGRFSSGAQQCFCSPALDCCSAAFANSGKCRPGLTLLMYSPSTSAAPGTSPPTIPAWFSASVLARPLRFRSF